MEDFNEKLNVSESDPSSEDILEDVRSASEAFNKRDLIRAHVRSYIAFHKAAEPIFNRPSSAPPKGLQPIQLAELRLENSHTGRVLYGTLCVDAFRAIDMILTVLEDVSGRAVRVKINVNGEPSSASTYEDVQRLYPKGAKVGVNEPRLKRAANNCLILWVDNPSNIECVSSFPVPNDECLSVEELRKVGNRCFGDEDWMGAINLYSQCIERATNEEPVAMSSTSANQTLLLSFSNRAETWLKLNNFERALCDCDKALEIDPHHVKTIYRRGRALHGLQQYEEAITCLQSALEHSSENGNAAEIKARLDRAVKFNTQSKTGKYDLSRYFLGAEYAPEVADFVGSVILKRTDDGRGRGLFATENVRAGDLLVVSNALAYSVTCGNIQMEWSQRRLESLSRINVITKLVTLTSPKALRQLLSLQYSSCEENGLEVPSMDLFKPNTAHHDCFNGGPAGQEMQVDMDRIIKIFKENSFGGKIAKISSRASGVPMDGMWSGLWALPSLINHSCLPNAKFIHIGEAVFIHATCSIPKGQEVNICYGDALMPFVARSESCRGWGFTCTCKRCKVEGPLQARMERITTKYFEANCFEQRILPRITPRDEFMQKLDLSNPSIMSQMHREMEECADFVAEVEKMISSPDLRGLKPEEKQWIRASFAMAYLRPLPPKDFSVSASASFIPTEKTFMDCVKLTDPGSSMLYLLSTTLIIRSIMGSSVQKQKALQIAREACVAVIGNQEELVLDAFIHKPTSMFHFISNYEY
eukprot:Gb_00792 [translate_table: standard]